MYVMRNMYVMESTNIGCTDVAYFCLEENLPKEQI